jgi:hypothetical protein
MIKPLVADVFQHPLSYLAGLSALSWMTFAYTYLSTGVSDMSGMTQLCVTSVFGLFALRVLILANSALRDTK